MYRYKFLIVGIMMFGPYMSSYAKVADTIKNDAIHLMRKVLTMRASKQMDSVQWYVTLAEKAATKDSNYRILTLIYIEKAKIDAGEEHEMTFLQNIRKAAHFLNKDSSRTFADDYYTLLAHFSFRKKEYPKTLRYLDTVEVLRAQYAPFKNWKTYRFMAMVHKTLGNQNKAAGYIKKSESLAELQNTYRQLDDLQAEFDVGSNLVRLSKLQMEIDLSSAESARFKAQQLLYVSGILLSIVIIIILILFLIQHNRWNKILSSKNQKIELNLKEKEVLVQEIHHRVKNNLQLISSLLSLQSRSVKDEKAFKALHEGQTRVQSMALIHQNLYKDNIYSGMEVKQYVTQLTTQLLQTYGLDPNKIELKLDVDPLCLDVSTLVPLALIINELITNALKYAFEEKEKGSIFISLKPKSEHQLELKVKDSGRGFTDVTDSEGFGRKLISALAMKLDADVIFKNEGGALVVVLIKNFKMAL